MRRRVLHLVGSAVDDFHADLSRLYARDCLDATADEALYEFHIAYVTPDRRWRFPADLGDAAISAAPSMSVGDAVGHLTGLGVDVVVPQMFCLPGMTSYRALFDVLAIPYIGNTPEVMALGAHKARAKAVVAAAGVPVPAGRLVRAGQPSSIPLPVVVKPVDSDNSFGVTLVRRPGEYTAAVDAALAHSSDALVEAYVELGREVRCGVIVRDGRLVCLPLEEYRVDSAVRTREDKIARDAGGDMRLVAKDPSRAWIVDAEDPVNRRVRDLATACHRALGCRHYSLFDFRVDADGTPWFLEAGLYSSFARQSVISVMAAAAGIPVDELFAAMVRDATSP